MITLLKILPEKWEQAKGYLRLDLEAIEAAMNQRWSATFGSQNLLNPDTIQDWDPTQTRYVSNEATSPEAGWPKWAQVNLANGVKNRLPFSNFVAATDGSKLVGRRSGSAGDFEEISLGPGLVMQSTTLQVDLGGLAGRIPIPDEPYPDDPWPLGTNAGSPIQTAFAPGSVIFAGPSGILSEDNAGLYFDSTNNRLGVGVASPSDNLDVRATTPIIGARFDADTGFASWRFYEITTLTATVQFIGSNFTTVNRRNNLELFNLTATGSITFHTNNSATPQMTLNSSGVLSLSTLTAGRVVVVGTSGALSDDSALLWDSTNNFLGIGITPAGTLDVSGTFSADQAFAARLSANHNTATAGTVYGGQFNATCSHTSGTMNSVVGLTNAARFQATANTTNMTGMQCFLTIQGTSPTGTINTAQGLNLSAVANFASGTPAVTFTQLRGLIIGDVGNGNGTNGLTVTNSCAMSIAGSQTAVTNSAVINISNTTSVPFAPSGTWCIFNASTRNNHFAGPLLMGGTTAAGGGTNYMSFANGTAVTSTAADTSAVYAADTAAGDSNLFATNEQDYVTQLTGLDIAKTADESVANNTPQNDDHLLVNLPATSRYQFKFYLFATSPATAGLLLQLDGTAGVSSLKANIQIFDSTGASVAFNRITAFNSSVGVDFTGDAYAVIEGVIEVSTAGTFRLEWAQNTTDAGNATVLQENSSLRLRRLNA